MLAVGMIVRSVCTGSLLIIATVRNWVVTQWISLVVFYMRTNACYCDVICVADTVTYITIALLQYGHTALMVASLNGHAEVVKKLIYTNADIDTQAHSVSIYLSLV